MPDWILQVSDLNEYVRRSLAADPMLRSLRIRGEISNFKAHSSGHWYFTLKDDQARIACVMFRQNAMRMSLRPRDGMAVVLSGSVSLYTQSGTYQFYAENMRPDGVGGLYQQFEALKARLAAEGLFDAARKKPLPLRPKKIAVVTSRTGAVLQDIRRVAAARDPGVPLVLLPVQVQGEGAAEDIAAAIRRAGTLPGVEVIIAGRGGGSMEDLWAFNEEIVVRAIADSPIPVISAVGHETDYTIADFVADVRAATPSNAAELAVPDRAELLEGLRMVRRHLTKAMDAMLTDKSRQVAYLARRLTAASPEMRLREAAYRLEQCRDRLDRAVERPLTEAAPRLSLMRIRLDHAMDGTLERQRQRLSRDRARLETLDPRRVLERGYALVTDGDRVIATRDAAMRSPRMTLHFRDGAVQVRHEED
ncbi:MAG: exodeoxyribonuclease VII large subunit [Eubacteriales bacterium]|nr:exodeoxyribonuclease VII large subunit [Eubacteriales bacterium]